MKKYYALTLLIALNIFSLFTPAKGAEKIMLYKGIFSRSVELTELEEFKNNEITEGFLKTIINESNKNEVLEVLKKEYKAPLPLTSKLMYSKIGETILKRIGAIIYPHRIQEESISVLAIKAATIEALAINDEKFNIVNFFKAYPSKTVVINITELSKVLNRVESMKELVDFFTNSPLEKLKR